MTGALALVMAVGCARAQTERLTVPAGITPLADIGLCQAGWQSYNGAEHLMPVGWTGFFDDTTGISYAPDESVLGRRAILLNSPWRVPTGRTWVDYPLQLPPRQPITLSFGITMRPDVVEKSEGVTFSAALVDGARVSPLFKEFYRLGQWKDVSFDLSAFAGHAITLRLQVEPGPKHDPSFSFSYFGDAKLTVGAGGEDPGREVDALLANPALRATDSLSLASLANVPEGGITPPDLPVGGKTVGRIDGQDFTLSYVGPDLRLSYHWHSAGGTLDDLTAEVGGRVLHPCWGGGVLVAKTGDGTVRATGGEITVSAAGDDPPAARVDVTHPTESGPLKVRYVFTLRGKGLEIAVQADRPVVGGFSLGHVAGAPLRRLIAVPYLYGTVEYLGADRLFGGRYLDWTRSGASACPLGDAQYKTKTDGTRNPLAEIGYVTLSPCVDEVLPNLNHPRSPFIGVLGDRIMLDVWRHHGGTYLGDAENLRELKDNGVDHVAIIDHDWQRYGYDVKLPDHIPANARYGSEADLAAFGRAATESGYLWSLHEDYIGVYPDAPSYKPAERVLNSDGTPSKDWFNGSVQSFGLKCNLALGYAQRNSPYIHRTYGTTAAYLDVHTCVPPWHELDCDAAQPMAAMLKSRVVNQTQLFQYMRDTHGGPLFGEGAWQFYWAGRCDGVEAQVAGGEDHVPFLDFDLLRLHPQMVNHGMGYYERWYRAGYDHRDGFDTGAPEQVDKYRAMELAYGHAGFVGNEQTDNIQWVAKEHHLMHAVQRLYGAAKATDIRYEVAGRLVPTSVALAVGHTDRQRVTYDSGLTLWVNWSAQPWTVEGRILPQWGFLALGPGTEVSTTLRDGKFADWADTPAYVFADARTSFNMPYLRPPTDVAPSIEAFRDLGGGQIELTYQWRVGEPLGADYHCFVHGVNKGAAINQDIVWQQDHTLPKPTMQWKAGDVLTDGPYRVTLPATFDTYDIVIGLYTMADSVRLALTGRESGDHRILLGRLRLTREGDKVIAVKFTPVADLPPEGPPKADFTAHLNALGTLIDFGALATDGSVKVERGNHALTVLPYPRDKAFTVSLDVARLSGAAVTGAVTVHAQAALTKADMGAVATWTAGKRVAFKVGLPGAGRFVVTW